MHPPHDDSNRSTALIERLHTVDGWLRDAQAHMLWDAAHRLSDDSTIVEIGSFHGKSTIVLATAAPPSARLFAIDPHAGTDRNPGDWTGTIDEGEHDHQQFLANLERYEVLDRTTHIRRFSYDAHDCIDGPIDLLYVDGAHGYAPALADITDWGDRVPVGGRMIIHDVYNSFFVSLAVIRRLWFSRRWRKVARTTSMAIYERGELRGREYATSVLVNLAEIPHFLRNMTIKTMRAAGVERAARVLGHRRGERLY